jgi:hypothetical protein
MALTHKRRGHHLRHGLLVQGPALEGWLCATAFSEKAGGALIFFFWSCVFVFCVLTPRQPGLGFFL